MSIMDIEYFKEEMKDPYMKSEILRLYIPV